MCTEQMCCVLSARCGGAAGNVHAQVGFDFGAESAFAKATVDTDISDKAAVASATWFQRGAPAWEGSRVAGIGASTGESTGPTWRALLSSLGRGRWELARCALVGRSGGRVSSLGGLSSRATRVSGGDAL